MLSAVAKSAILLMVPSLNKVEVRNFPLLQIAYGSVWLMDNLVCLCDVWKGRSYVNSHVSVSSIFNNGQFYLKYYFLHHRNPLSFREIQLSVNCYVSVLIFHQNAKTITVLYTYSTWRNVPKLPKNVPYWRQQTDVTKMSFLNVFLKMLFYIIVFWILAVGKHINMQVNT